MKYHTYVLDAHSVLRNRFNDTSTCTYTHIAQQSMIVKIQNNQ